MEELWATTSHKIETTVAAAKQAHDRESGMSNSNFCAHYLKDTLTALGQAHDFAVATKIRAHADLTVKTTTVDNRLQAKPLPQAGEEEE